MKVHQGYSTHLGQNQLPNSSFHGETKCLTHSSVTCVCDEEVGNLLHINAKHLFQTFESLRSRPSKMTRVRRLSLRLLVSCFLLMNQTSGFFFSEPGDGRREPRPASLGSAPGAGGPGALVHAAPLMCGAGESRGTCGNMWEHVGTLLCRGSTELQVI